LVTKFSRIKQAALIFGILLGLQLLSLTAGAIYQSIASAADRQTFPALGKLMDIHGQRLHIFCSGPHIPRQPTVILEGGLGAPSFVWDLVQPKIAQVTRVCSYDRAGYGWSDPGPQPRTARQIVDELHSLLQHSGESGPYLLVGHSLGGVVARIYAAKYPQQVSGLILVDPRHEDFFTRMPAGYQQIDQNNLRDARTLKLIAPFGATRLLAQTVIFGRFENYIAPLPDSVKARARALMVHNPQHWATAVAEREASPESYAQARDSRLPKDLPLIVLSAENGVKAWKSPTITITDLDRETWLTLQKEQAELSSNSQWIIVKDSGHYIHLDCPTTLVKVIASMLVQNPQPENLAPVLECG
jgi:pimeloyl-ACP methyl ester carboxylesterase